ncbi:hypothetical protein CSA56_10455 [candidate division KSB3 bacterium]|uniref:Soluble ligand binding domain-containing protein n=1 Tax=candidate division KSB3 bacterium TaxID=2044937 RepID=A0A2G6KDJ0_9BACT|nr:MAG: hypothetical protein CSA56_10455 [candidate division KSB3 bacterium]
MKLLKLCCVFILGVFVLVGCGSISLEDGVSEQSIASEGQDSKGGTPSSATTIVGVSKKSVKDKPGVTRVVLSLNKKASYATSREGNQLIVNVFNAQMTASMKQLEVRDPVVKSIVAKQVGSSVKNIIELVSPDIAYTPSTSTDPYQILIDIWQISPKAVSQKDGGTISSTAVPGPVKKIDIESTDLTPSDPKKTTLETSPVTRFSASETMPEDMPAQLEWFSEKLSAVLQERERIKQELFEVEKSVAVKDSMIQVLERKVKEANNRIVEIEEEMIKVKSTTSLVEQNEQAMRQELQAVLDQLEGKSVEPSSLQSDGDLQKILPKIAALQDEKNSLSLAHDQVGSLKERLDSLLTERDGLRAQNETMLVEVDSLKGQVAKMASVEQQLRVKEQELNRIRKAVGMTTSPAVVTAPVVSAQPIDTGGKGISDISTLSVADTQAEDKQAETTENTQLVLENLIQQQITSQGPTEEYILGPDDMIQIKVLNEDNLDKTVTVSTDGFITYPLLGDLRVDGLTTAQLDAQITTLLEREYLVNPEVLVDVLKPRSKKVYIMGMVKQPGYQELQGDHRLLGTMLNAGGPTSFSTEARILRLPKGELSGGGEALAPIVTDLASLFVDGDQTQNVLLEDGDVVMVAAKGAKGQAAVSGDVPTLGPQQFYVVGSVEKPGIYTYQENDTVLDAILRAGGFSEFASRNGTKVVRELDGKTKTFQVKMKDVMESGEMEKNIVIMPGDMIIVPESFF